MLRWLTKCALFIALGAASLSARAAEHLDCMTNAIGGAEQAVLDRDTNARRGEDARGAVVTSIIQARARACGYLYGWSESAIRLAVQYTFARHQWAKVPTYTQEEDARLKIAIEPRRAQLLAMFDQDIAAIRRGENAPAPDSAGFRDFYPLTKSAKIDPSKEHWIDGWLYMYGTFESIAVAFSSE